MEGTDGSAGLKVLPIDSVTLSDGYDPRERAPTRLDMHALGTLAFVSLGAQNGPIWRF